MGIYKFIAVVIALAMILMPLIAIDSGQVNGSTTMPSTALAQNYAGGENQEAVKVFMSQDDFVLTITLQEYLVGASIISFLKSSPNSRTIPSPK